MSKTYKDSLPRNNSFEALRKRRAGTGGSGMMKARNAPRSGNRNEQRELLEEYELDCKDTIDDGVKDEALIAELDGLEA
jgi:hypothetical protein